MPEALENEDKVVYVLGAGFSIPAGAPTQAQILDDILNLDVWPEKVGSAKTRLEAFLTSDLRIRREDIPQIALEDVYTPIDRCIADGTSFKSKNVAELKQIREDLGYLISIAISRRIARRLSTGDANSEYIRTFARYLVAKAKKKADYAKEAKDSNLAKAYDPLAIISLNWDILLDNAIHSELCERHPDNEGDYDPFGVVDYCCYISSVEAGDKRTTIRSVESRMSRL